MSKRRRCFSESESESEPAAEEANGGESEEADEPYSTGRLFSILPESSNGIMAAGAARRQVAYL